jgi:hypothetical protein
LMQEIDSNGNQGQLVTFKVTNWVLQGKFHGFIYKLDRWWRTERNEFSCC